MKLTKLKPPKLSENTITAFGGLNKNPNCPENFFSNTQNTSSELYPLLSTREKRTILCYYDSAPSALHTLNGITVIDGKKLIYNNVVQYKGLSIDSDKQLVSMGSLVIVFPDGYYFNTLTSDESGVCTDKGFLAQKNSISSKKIQYFPCLSDAIPTISSTAPANSNENDLWLDTSTNPDTLYIYSLTTKSWSSIAPTHICIKAEGISNNLNVGDGIEISGAPIDINGANIITGIGNNYIIISGTLDELREATPAQSSPLTVERKIPTFDFVCEHQNRLFGCRYGENENGEFVNEIYSSKLGDPKNWNCFAGLSTDSYVASCGSEGPWTGVISHMGYVVFFKENKIHRLFGSKPSNFTLYQDNYPGVKLGSEKSLCIINGTLYYHSEHGIYSYSGSSPICISDSLSNNKYSNAIAATCKNTYYVCMSDNKDNRSLFSYNTQNQIWHREDNSNFYCLSSIDGNVIGLKKQDYIYTLELLQSSNIPDICSTKYFPYTEHESNFDWFAESGKIGLSHNECKFINRIRIRFEADIGSAITVYLQTDSSGKWEKCGSFTSVKLSPCNFDIVPPRCDHFHIKITGYGACKIYSLTKIIESASEVF